MLGELFANTEVVVRHPQGDVGVGMGLEFGMDDDVLTMQDQGIGTDGIIAEFFGLQLYHRDRFTDEPGGEVLGEGFDEIFTNVVVHDSQGLISLRILSYPCPLLPSTAECAGIRDRIC